MPEFWPEAPHFGQQIFLLSIYCYALFIASGKIAKGCDILRDTYGSGIVGSILLPLLGAIPDGIIILVSGLAASGTADENAERISIALGSLVGATVLLTTLAPCTAIFLGSVALHDDGATLSEYRPIAPGSNKLVLKPVLPEGFSIFKNGVNTLGSTPKTALWLILSCSTYLIIQIPSLFIGDDAADQKPWLIVALIFSLFLFSTYLFFMARDTDNATMIEARRIQIHKFLNWGHENKQLIGSLDPVSLFQLLDTDGDGALDAEDLHRGLRVLGLDLTHKEARAVLNLIDIDGNISIQLNEFVAFVKEYILSDTDVLPGSLDADLVHSASNAQSNFIPTPATPSGKKTSSEFSIRNRSRSRSTSNYGATDSGNVSSGIPNSYQPPSTYMPQSYATSMSHWSMRSGKTESKDQSPDTNSRTIEGGPGVTSTNILINGPQESCTITIPGDDATEPLYSDAELSSAPSSLGSLYATDISMQAIPKPISISRKNTHLNVPNTPVRNPAQGMSVNIPTGNTPSASGIPAFPRNPSSVAFAKPSLSRPGSFIPLGSYVPSSVPVNIVVEPCDEGETIKSPLLARRSSSDLQHSATDPTLASQQPFAAAAAADAAVAQTPAKTAYPTPKYIRREHIVVAEDEEEPVLIYAAPDCDDRTLTPDERATGPPPIDSTLMAAVLQWYRSTATHAAYVRAGTRQRWALHLWASRTQLGHISEDNQYGRVIKLMKGVKKPRVHADGGHKHCQTPLARRLVHTEHPLALWKDKSFPRFANASDKVLHLARKHADNPLKGVYDRALELSAVAFQQNEKEKRRKVREASKLKANNSNSDSEGEDEAIIPTPVFTGVTLGGLLLFAQKYGLPLTPKQVKTHFFSHDSDLDRELAPNDLKRLLEDLVEGHEEEEEVEDEVCEAHEAGHHMDGWTENQKKLYGVGLLLLGTLIILVFSDPTIEMISAMGNSLGIRPLYLSFTVLPIAANMAELTTAFFFAMGKSDVTMTLTLNSTLGANVMNNTFCVAIFLLLLISKDLAWVYSAEVITLLIVQILSAVICMRQTLRQWHALVLGAMYPMSIALIYVLSNVLRLK